jgi:hypothetical protein
LYFNVPILFVVFNRPETTEIVLRKIREIRPNRLYIAADGPRSDVFGEDELCIKVRDLISKGIDWQCDLSTLYRQENLGCKLGVSSAINWFFENEEEGIILEDDCLPDISFFLFAQEMLEKYRNDENIIAINGCNFGYNYNESSYFYSRYMNVWGWATWRRVNSEIRYDITDWHNTKKIRFLRSRLKNKIIDLDITWFEYWKEIFDNIADKKLDSWAFFWIFHQFLNNKKNIISSRNLIKNIGFNKHATHTKYIDHSASNLQINELHFPLLHPSGNSRKINKNYEDVALKPVCYMYYGKTNSYYIKNWFRHLPLVKAVLKIKKRIR